MYNQPAGSPSSNPRNPNPLFRPQPHGQRPPFQPPPPLPQHQQIPSVTSTSSISSPATTLQFYSNPATPHTTSGQLASIPQPQYTGRIGSGLPVRPHGVTGASTGAGGFSSQNGPYNSNSGIPSGPIPVDWAAAFGTGGFPGEEPLLQELGINFAHIKYKSVSVLNPTRNLDPAIMEDSDLAGPLVFYFAFGLFLLTSGKAHFGYIYGVAAMGCLSIYAILNLMAYNASIDSWRAISILGYCLLPMVILSVTSNFLALDGYIGLLATAVTVLWCTVSATNMFVTVLSMRDQRFLIAYPIGLYYAVFALLTVFKA